jgi:hypothetical protein
MDLLEVFVSPNTALDKLTQNHLMVPFLCAFCTFRTFISRVATFFFETKAKALPYPLIKKKMPS